ncbi:hypothetical protein ACFQGT_10165 [Natrialbaceae archaeon GCM10025810]|uniref:hypothetical protein n=1 Tax=Halovalidus salilacus TaxID=3075124 RepID=UPI003623386D
MEQTSSAGESGASEPRGGRRERYVDWILLRGNRGLIGAGIAAVLGTYVSALVVSDLVPLENVQALFYAFSGLITGNLTLITVVVSINQILLSRELSTPSELKSQIGNVVSFRGDVEEAAGEVAPVMPQGFLRLLVEATREGAQRLGGLARTDTGPEAADELDEVVSTLTEQLDRVDGLLKRSGTGTFGVLSTLLETNYAEQFNRLRRIKSEHDADVPPDVEEAIDDLLERLARSTSPGSTSSRSTSSRNSRRSRGSSCTPVSPLSGRRSPGCSSRPFHPVGRGIFPRSRSLPRRCSRSGWSPCRSSVRSS